MQDLDYHGLVQLRGAEENGQLARRALGVAASPKQVKSLANYFSRIINGRVPKVSAEMLQLLATGLGYTSLTQFYSDWEWVSTGEALPYRGYAANLLATAFTQNAPRGEKDNPSDTNGGISGRARERARPDSAIRADSNPSDSAKEVHAPTSVSGGQFARDLRAVASACAKLAHVAQLIGTFPLDAPASHSRHQRSLGGHHPRQPAHHSRPRAKRR
jgi:hypothetical protein